MDNAFSKILGSKKAVLSILGIICSMILAYTGKVTGEDTLNFIKWVLMAWLSAQAAEDVTMHVKGTHPDTLKLQAQLAKESAPTETKVLVEKSGA
jgi:hypothetical protein